MSMASLSASLLARKGQARPSAAVTGVRSLQELLATRPAPGKPVTAKAPQPKAAKTVSAVQPPEKGRRIAKTLRLDAGKSRSLRLLAAAKGVSQQCLMQEAVEKLLEHETANGRCVCGAALPAAGKNS